MVGLKDYSQYQKFVELLNCYYCGAKHFLTKLESSGAGEVEQDQLDRLRKEHEDLNIHIDSAPNRAGRSEGGPGLGRAGRARGCSRLGVV